MNQGQVRDLMTIIDRVYGPGTEAAARVAATNVLAYFENKGWISPEELAYIVDAAGGEIIVTMEAVEDSKPKLQIQNDFPRDRTVFTVRPETSRNPKRTVNPDAESRNVDSGPIDLNIT